MEKKITVDWNTLGRLVQEKEAAQLAANPAFVVTPASHGALLKEVELELITEIVEERRTRIASRCRDLLKAHGKAACEQYIQKSIADHCESAVAHIDSSVDYSIAYVKEQSALIALIGLPIA